MPAEPAGFLTFQTCLRSFIVRWKRCSTNPIRLRNEKDSRIRRISHVPFCPSPCAITGYEKVLCNAFTAFIPAKWRPAPLSPN